MNIKELNELHKLLRKAKYDYYVEHISVISDFEYDMLEKKYREACEIHNIPEEIKPYLLQRRNNRADDWLKLYNENINLQEKKKNDLEDKINKVFELHNQGLTHLKIALLTGYERSSVTKILNKKPNS